MEPGDRILPAAQTGVRRAGAGNLYRPDRVYISPRPWECLFYLDNVVHERFSGGLVYEVEPVGEIEPDLEYPAEEDNAWTAEAAIVVGVERGPLTGAEKNAMVDVMMEVVCCLRVEHGMFGPEYDEAQIRGELDMTAFPYADGLRVMADVLRRRPEHPDLAPGFVAEVIRSCEAGLRDERWLRGMASRAGRGEMA